MAITQILENDYFYQWRDKTNEISADLGDLADLDTTDKTDIVSAINEVFAAIPPQAVDTSITPEFTVGIEATDVVNVAVQFKDAEDENITYPLNIRIYLSDDVDGLSLLSTPHSSGMVIGTEGLLIPVIADKMAYITTNATGAFDVDIEEAGAKTAYLVIVMPDGTLAISTAITHAA